MQYLTPVRPRPVRRRLLGAAVLVSSLALGPAAYAKTTAAPVKRPPAAAFPSLQVTDIRSGKPFDLAGLAANGGRPTMVWFWAPH